MADPQTVSDALRLMDEGWATFLDRVHALPTEQLELQLGENGWTRKQMLAHIGTWHDLTSDRIARFRESGTPADSGEHEDVINARASRAATGRTSGEILQGMQDSFRRLRREVAQLTDEQLAANDSWAVAIVRDNSFGHYEEHLGDLTARR